MAAAQTISAGAPGVSARDGAELPEQLRASRQGAAGNAAVPNAPSSGPRNETTAIVPLDATLAEEAVQDIGQDRHSFSPTVMRLPVELDVMVPVKDFRVRNLLTLSPEQVIESQWGHGEDVPVAAGEIALAWSEFEVIETQLAVRITRLA